MIAHINYTDRVAHQEGIYTPEYRRQYEIANENLRLAVQNLPRVRLVPTGQLTARDLIGSSRVVMSQAAVERLAQVLGS